MKKMYLLVTMMLIIALTSAQVINVNPDKSGEPWLLGGLRIPTKAEEAKVPVIKNITPNSFRDVLPESLDNTTLPYFRPIFNQTHGCCAQASGIAYNFTYEYNRSRGTSANVPENQFPSHYTYNFLNGGSGENGSYYWDGWEIVKANGCPTIETYGSLDQESNYWMSGYDKYSAAQENRLSDYFRIDIGTPEGLETLKYWMLNHLEDGATDGGIVNFAAGINIEGYNMTYNNIVTRWGVNANHAMTFVGWDDNIEYDYNDDGEITNDVDINGDGIVNMQDWERGALIMVNTWGYSWGNYGKAYVMYKLLAEPISEGGIYGSRVYSLNIREPYTPKLSMKVKMSHNSRKKIKIKLGVSTDLDADEPEHEISFPIFNHQGGDYNMKGYEAGDIEFVIDITPILSHVENNEETKFFLIVDENDEYSSPTGKIVDFSIFNTTNEYTSTQHNVDIINNSRTYLTLNASLNFDAPEIQNESLMTADQNSEYSEQFTATGGEAPYTWAVVIDFDESSITDNYPDITSNKLDVSDNDDGLAIQTLDFDFPFYGEIYNQVSLFTDGSITFQPNFQYIRSEENIMESKTISVFASDLMIYPVIGDGIFYEGDANSATFRWKTSLYDDASANVDAAITIYPSGEIKFFYGDNITQDLSWAAGISNGDGISYSISKSSNINNPSGLKYLNVPEAFPTGLSMSKNGIFEGTPINYGKWDIKFAVTDFNGITKTKVLEYEVNKTTSGINTINQLVNVSPNPAKDKLVFTINKSYNNASIQIFDISGKIIETMSIKQSKEFVWNINNETPSGVYFYNINIDGSTEKGKFIKL